MRNIVSLYIDKYNIRDNESEEKRIRGLIKKLHEKKSIFCDFPFDYMMENEQLELLHYIMTTLPERQIMANIKKVDADRCYMNFVYRSDESKTVTKNILENVLGDYNTISLSNEILNSRYIIRDPGNSIDEILKYLLEANEMIIRLYFQEEQQFKILGLKAYNFGYIKEYIDYTANVLLQLLVYRVINESNVESINVIKELSDKIDEIDELIEKQLGRRKMEWTD